MEEQSAPPAKKFTKIIGIAIIGLVVVGGIAGAMFMLNKSKRQTVSTTPPPAPTTQQAVSTSFTLTSAKNSYRVGDQIAVSLLAKSDGDAANLFVAKMRFPADLLQVVNINFKSSSGSARLSSPDDVANGGQAQIASTSAQTSFISNWFVTNWVENTFDNKTGAISLVGGVPNPGYQTQSDQPNGALMADIIFEAKKAGSATLAFDPTSSIYRNSDNANILKAKKDLTLEILDIAPTASPSASVNGDINGDGKVDLTDLSALFTFWHKTGADVGKADLNNDQVVNTFDFSTLNNILAQQGVLQNQNSEESPSAEASAEEQI